MKEIIDKYKREPIVIAVVVGIVLYVLYLLISPYQRCMSTAPDKYLTYDDGSKKIAYNYASHKNRCLSKTSF